MLKRMPKRVQHIAIPESDLPPRPKAFRAYMTALGRKGGRISGARRMVNLTATERRRIATKAARARWAKKKPAPSA